MISHALDFLLDVLFPRSFLLARLRRYQFTETEQPSPRFAGLGSLFLQFIYRLSNTSGAIAKLGTGSEREGKKKKAYPWPQYFLSGTYEEISMKKSEESQAGTSWEVALCSEIVKKYYICMSGIEAFTSKSNFFYSSRDDHVTHRQ